MTYTVADAEAAIARHPESLEQLSMAADLLIELGDPRGEDFAACLGETITAEEVQRRHPGCRYAMFVAAWRIESDGQTCGKCDEYIGVGQVPSDPNAYNARWGTCPLCAGSGDDGSSARAEALRLLAECGKVGTRWAGLTRLEIGYFMPNWTLAGDQPISLPGIVPMEWTRPMTQLKDLTYSPQKGPPGHCFVAQVWGPDGKSLAVVEPTDDPAEATNYARLFALSPKLLAFARDIATNYDHEGRDECYRGCRVCAAEQLLAEYEVSKPVHLGET